jgi:bacterioferritin (cytochrome b1)
MLSRSHSEYVEGESLIDMIREDLVAKLVVIESYREMINNFGNDDAISRQMLEAILAAEEERLGDLAALLEKLARPAWSKQLLDQAIGSRRFIESISRSPHAAGASSAVSSTLILISSQWNLWRL